MVEQESLPVLVCDLYSLTPRSWESYSIYLSNCVKLCGSCLGLKFTWSLFWHMAGHRRQHLLTSQIIFSTAFPLGQWHSPHGTETSMGGPQLSFVVCSVAPFSTPALEPPCGRALAFGCIYWDLMHSEKCLFLSGRISPFQGALGMECSKLFRAHPCSCQISDPLPRVPPAWPQTA